LARAKRGGDVARLGAHGVDQARRSVAEALAAHRPLPLDEATARELAALVDRAAGTGAHARKGR